jgi:hypothetical protein
MGRLCYVANIVDVFVQKIVARQVATGNDTNLVMTLCGWHCGSATPTGAWEPDPVY